MTLPQLQGHTGVPNLPRRATRVEETFGVNCSACRKSVEIPVDRLIGLRAACHCGAKLTILWRAEAA